MMLALNGIGGGETMLPHTVAPRAFVEDIFGIPLANAVGTLDFGDGLSAVMLDETKGGGRRLASSRSTPIGVGRLTTGRVFADRLVCWMQGRALMVADIEDESVSYAIAGSGIEEQIRSFAGLSEAPLRMVIEVLQRGDDRVRRRLLRVIEVRDERVFVLGESAVGTVSYGYNPPWTVTGATLLVGDAGAPRLDAFGLDFKAVKHPFATLVNDQDTLRRLAEIAVHPTLPFAVLIDRSAAANERYLLYCARWDTDNEAVRPVPLGGSPDEDRYYSHVSFSPDGAWLVCRDDSEDDLNPEFIALPVDARSPTCLGAPVHLGQCPGGEVTSTAWATEPTTFVACGGGALYCWRLDETGK
ncbi:MAG: hypothetical protein GF331_14660 [Chitinivibrionales bacterium]|nr:hypothetical protein [Chitinivibrionales bacterium]